MAKFLGSKLFSFFLLIPFTEIFIRLVLGIGNPILFKSHPTIEYEQLPSQNIRVFHNDIFINSLGMRSDELSFPKKENIKRIIIYGDSIIFGGNFLSNERLATTTLKRKLNLINNKYEIGNISSGSWGPGNWLAHIKERGIYNADHVLIVINSDDFYDVPNYQSINKNPRLPKKKPLFATIFFAKRYLFPSIKNIFNRFNKINSLNNDKLLLIKKYNRKNSIERKNSLEDIKEIIKILKTKNTEISVIQFWDKNEFLNNKPKNSNLIMRDIFTKNNINVIQSIDYFKICSLNADDLYFDNIHPYKSLGQDCLADLMKKSLESNKSLEINKK